jgi:tetratricopeptide (TPR) repeat protein
MLSKTPFFLKSLLVAVSALALATTDAFAVGRGGGGGGGRGGSWGGARASFGAVGPARSGAYGLAGGGGGARSGAYANYYNGGWGSGWGRGGWGWGGWGWGWPAYAALGLGWGYPYGYGYGYGYPDNGYYYTYAPADYADTGYADNGAVAGGAAIPPAAPSAPGSEMTSDQQQASSDGLQFYSEGREDFLQGDYRGALRMAGHAAVDAPNNPKVHELISLSLFSLGNYTAAASEAHAAMTLGPIAQWKDLYGYYNNVDKYTTQLRALEKASTDNPKSAADHFLLGYHYLMTGSRDNAKTELAEAVKLTPNDKLASHYLQQLISNSPLTPPQMATRPGGESR